MRMCTSLGLSSFEVRPRISLVTYMLANSCIFHIQRCEGIKGDFYLWKFLHTTRSDIIGFAFGMFHEGHQGLCIYTQDEKLSLTLLIAYPVRICVSCHSL